MPKRGQKIVDHTPETYSLRFYIPEDREYVTMLNEWLSQRAPDVSQGQQLRAIVKAMMDSYQGINPVETPIERELVEIKRLLLTLISKPELANRIAAVSQRESGDDIDDDVIDNILEDMGR